VDTDPQWKKERNHVTRWLRGENRYRQDATTVAERFTPANPNDWTNGGIPCRVRRGRSGSDCQTTIIEQCGVMVTANHRMTTVTDVGVVLVSATAVFTARLVCEETFVAWVRGAPWEGFSPVHSIVDLIGALCALLTLIWALIAMILAGVNKSRLTAVELTLVAVAVACCGLRAVPYEDWQLLMVRLHGAGHVPRQWVVSAAANGQIRLLDYLLAHGVDVNTRVQHGESPLGAAAAEGQLEAARLLIARGARLDNRTVITLETPLTEAAQMNRTDMVKLLLDHGANPGAIDVLDRTALDWAHENGNYRMASLLLARTRE
jgi:hypothetical protein